MRDKQMDVWPWIKLHAPDAVLLKKKNPPNSDFSLEFFTQIVLSLFNLRFYLNKLVPDLDMYIYIHVRMWMVGRSLRVDGKKNIDLSSIKYCISLYFL